MTMQLCNKWGQRDDGVIQIELTQGQVALVDECDLEKVLAYRWCAHAQKNGRWYAATHPGYGRKDKRILHMHRLIMGAPKGTQVDHVNLAGLDNRRANLRFATLSQNLANARRHRDKKSPYKGTYFDKRRSHWRAAICVNGQQIHLGCFDDEIDAAIAYNEAATKYFGEFARLNDLIAEEKSRGTCPSLEAIGEVMAQELRALQIHIE